ncbi:RDD family protein [Calycomorphotria hydatis]|uniref:RDD family protein n=1 Tax=Calycomorphotria hydatis TaxID=2528027 RepID=A0A517T5A3_9PLAN|nr:RDD family protein [Calycomorphotria hydatis]QDT63521.1 RDD family protein [Calycomorphotria hydatis]
MNTTSPETDDDSFQSEVDANYDEQVQQRRTVGCRLQDRILANLIDQITILILVAGIIIAVRDSGLHYALITLMILILVPSYYALFEGAFGATPGKYFYGLKVVSADESRCTFRQAWIRSLCLFVEGNPILLGALPAVISILKTDRRQRIGDLCAGTIVLNLNEATEWVA